MPGREGNGSSSGDYADRQAIGGQRDFAALERESVVAVNFTAPACESPDVRIVFGRYSVELSSIRNELGGDSVFVAAQLEQSLKECNQRFVTLKRRPAFLGIGTLVVGEFHSHLNCVQEGVAVSTMSKPLVNAAHSLQRGWRLRCVQCDFS